MQCLGHYWSECDCEVPEQLEPISYLGEHFYPKEEPGVWAALLMLAEFLKPIAKNADDTD